MAKNLIPRNDAERNVLTYRSMEEPLQKAIKRYSDKASKGMITKITNILTAAGYDGSNHYQVINKQADPSTLHTLEGMIAGLPDDDPNKRKLYSKLYGQVGSGSLTVRKAVADVTEFGRYEVTPKIYAEGRKQLSKVAKEAMLRGEYNVQKDVGLAWQINSPGIKQVDTFLKNKWSMNLVAGYMQPISKIVQDEISQGLLLGESPQKIANRMKRVEVINDVRANREARTITTAVANEAHMESYRKHGVKRYEFRATFDERTCPVCGSLDGRTFPISEKNVGANYPPIHPNCRCTTVAALSKELKERIYQNNVIHMKDGTVKPMKQGDTYERWKELMVDPKPLTEEARIKMKYKELPSKEEVFKPYTVEAVNKMSDMEVEEAYRRKLNGARYYAPKSQIVPEYLEDYSKNKPSNNFRKQAREWVKSLSPDIRKVGHGYTKDSSLNANFYNEPDAKVWVEDKEGKRTLRPALTIQQKREFLYSDIRRTEVLDNMISEFKNNEPLIVYKGMGNPFGMDVKDAVGKEWMAENFFSTSTSEKVAREYMKDKTNPVLFKILVPEGKGVGAYIAPMSEFEHHSELLLKRRSIFKVEGIDENGAVLVRVIG